MTARADRLTKGARTEGHARSVRSSHPASSARVFIDALERVIDGAAYYYAAATRLWRQTIRSGAVLR